MDTWFYSFVQILCRVYCCIYHRASYQGREHIPAEGPLIIAANHCSWLDPPIISAAIKTRKITFMAKKELFDIPVLRFLIRNLAAFPVDRDSSGDRKSYVETLKRLKEGRAVLIFPEGTRTKDGDLQDFLPGATRSALAVPGCQILPVRIRGSFESFGGGKKFPVFCKISVSVGECLDPGLFKDVKDKKQQSEIITQELRRVIEAL